MTDAVLVPPRRLAEPRSNAERKVLQWLERLPAGWYVLHSLGIVNHPFKRWAEADAVLIGPPGLLVLEIKGGRVRRRAGTWEYVDRHGHVSRSPEGPFDQAGGAHASIRRALVDAGVLSPSACSGYAVLLPDAELKGDFGGIDEVLLDAADRWGAPAAIVERWCRYWAARTGQQVGLSPDDRDRLVDHLRGDLDLQPSLALQAHGVDRQLSRLTAQQLRVVRAAGYNPRVLVQGRAGTGKTMLALDQARRAAEDGARVLLTCRSPHLAVRLREALPGPSVDVIAFESLTAGGRGGAHAVSGPYDVAIIDEAQDVSATDIEGVLDHRLIDGFAGGRWRIMHDPSQSLDDSGGSDASRLRQMASTVLQLSLNCRNTRQIAVTASILTRIELDNEAPATGPDVDRVWWSTEDEHDALLAATLRRLRSEVSPEAVAVLTRRPWDAERIRRIEQEARVALTPLDDPRPASMVLATVHEFKGLEADVVVAADIAELHDSALRRHAYVACTRARTHLTVMLHEGVRSDYDEGARWFGRLLTSRRPDGDDA